MKLKYYLQMLKFYNRLLSVYKLTRQASESDLNFLLNNNWSRHIREILKVLGKEENLDNHEKIDIKLADAKFKELMNIEFQQVIAKKPKLRSYRLFKS